MEYSAGLTSKLFWLQESRKTAGYILEGLSKADIRKIAWEENIYQVKAEYRAYEVLNGTYRRVSALPEAVLQAFITCDVETATILKSYVLKKKNDVVVFVRNLMDNVLYQDAYDVLSEKVDKTLRVVSRIRDVLKKDARKAKDQSSQLLDIANCDVFRELDNILIDWALDQLNDEILDAQIDGMNLAQIAEQRTAKSCHFGNVYKNEYQAIKYAYQMMKAVSVLEVTSDIKVMVADYQKQTYLIDSYYRWFYSAYDCIEDAERVSKLRERIENMYSFTYLQKVTPKWNQELTDNLMADTGLKRQEDFYRNYLKAYEGKNRVIVIISDAFRYECAKELMERLELDEKCTPKLDCMISSLPSVTSVGMASLLPHNELQVDDKLNVTVDGQSCGDLVYRDKDEWMDVLLRSTGLEPESFSERAKWLLIARMIPLVENNFNLCELGPRSTGKSYIYEQISPNSILVAGGQTTVANLFYNMSNHTVGLVGMWDCVAFDEVAGIKFKDKDGIQIMKGYMAYNTE